MKKILYISVHAVLEYDELSLFTELGYDCFSLGAYTNPAGHYALPRPAVRGMRERKDLEALIKDVPRTELPWQFIDNFDIIIVMDGYHAPTVLERNWEVFKNKKVIWRTIGQSLPEVELRLKKLRKEGLKIVRYSPKEKEMDFYLGEDAVIRFYKDPDEFGNWNGNTRQVINFSQSLKARRDFCGYDHVMKVAPGFPYKTYGTGNEDLGEFNGGELSYDGLKGALRDCRVYFYSGTWPASYTLGFIEAWMTGIPIVSIGHDFWRHRDNRGINLFEVPDLMEWKVNGFYSSSYDELREYIAKLLDDHELARSIGSKGREKAIELFGKEKIKSQWQNFLASLQ